MTGSFDRIMRGLQEAVEHARGDDVPGLVLHVPEKVDVAPDRRLAGDAAQLGTGVPDA